MPKAGKMLSDWNAPYIQSLVKLARYVPCQLMTGRTRQKLIGSADDDSGNEKGNEKL